MCRFVCTAVLHSKSVTVLFGNILYVHNLTGKFVRSLNANHNSNNRVRSLASRGCFCCCRLHCSVHTGLQISRGVLYWPGNFYFPKKISKWDFKMNVPGRWPLLPLEKGKFSEGGWWYTAIKNTKLWGRMHLVSTWPSAESIHWFIFSVAPAPSAYGCYNRFLSKCRVRCSI